MSLGIDSRSRTIDIDTSDQVHHIGGRFNEALSTSLSIHGAHEEALRRIEHYSMTSMHSSAHSIRSMDSIRMELSRLEGMITSASATHPPEIETGNTHRRRDSKSTERRNSAVEGGKRDSNMSISGPLPKHSGESSTARHSGTAFAPRQNSIDRTRKSQESSSQSQRTREVAAEHCIEFDHQISSTDYRSLVDETDDVKNRSMENPAQEGNKSSFLYAEFSKKSQPRQVESSAVEIDHGAIHRILRQSLAVIYPPEVVDYVSVKHFTTLCEDHMKMLDIRPNIQVSPNGKVKYVDDDTPASARPSMIHLKDRLIELRTAIQLSRERCIQAGYSLSELDNLLSSSGSGSYAPASQPPPMPETDGEDDSSSIYSEDFHSTTE